MATAADFQLVNQGFDALGRSLLQRKLAEDKDAEDIRRSLLDRQLQDYRNKELDLRSSDLEDQRANRAAALDVQKQGKEAATQHYKNQESAARNAQAVQMLHSLGDQVRSGVMAPEAATELLQQHLDSTTQGTPFKFSVAFQAPKSPAVNYTTNPASGAIQATYGNTMQGAGFDPSIAKPKPAPAYKTVTDEQGNPIRLPLSDAEVQALKNPAPPAGSFDEQLNESGLTPEEYDSIQKQLEREADFKNLKKGARAGTLDLGAVSPPTAVAGRKPATATAGQQGAPATPKTQAEYDAMPSGTLYLDPATGATKRKK